MEAKDKGRRTFLIFVGIGSILWLFVTLAVLFEVARSPADHVELGLGLLAIWIVLIVFAAVARLTESMGEHR